MAKKLTDEERAETIERTEELQRENAELKSDLALLQREDEEEAENVEVRKQLDARAEGE